jgi:DNA/RNA-binding domain of Phe-tRNA-synthetase-like protein
MSTWRCENDPVPLFRYADAVLDRFPSVIGGAVHAQGVTSGTSPPDLARAFAEEQRRVVERLGDRPLSELPGLAAWRRAFSAFGVEPTKYRSAAEALLRRLTKHGDIPSINLLVDLGNLVSIRYGMPVAVFDQRAVTGGTVVRFAEGSERFTDLGSDTAVNPAPGEVVFVDDAGLVSARRWCWRQSAESAARDDTTEVLVTVEGHHEDAAEDVAAAVADLVGLLEAHACPDALAAGILDPDAPSFNTARTAAGDAPGS